MKDCVKTACRSPNHEQGLYTLALRIECLVTQLDYLNGYRSSGEWESELTRKGFAAL